MWTGLTFKNKIEKDQPRSLGGPLGAAEVKMQTELCIGVLDLCWAHAVTETYLSVGKGMLPKGPLVQNQQMRPLDSLSYRAGEGGGAGQGRKWPNVSKDHPGTRIICYGRV